MALTKIRSVKFFNALVSAVTDLYDTPRQYGDLEVHVGKTTSKFHKLILAMQSKYFQTCLFPADEAKTGAKTSVHSITLTDIEPDEFQNVMRYMYTGEIELDCNTVGGSLRAARRFCLDDLEQLCSQFMADTLNVETCVQYWQVTREENNPDLFNTCLTTFIHEFGRVIKKTPLQDIAQDMIEAAMENDELNVRSEVEFCEVLLQWLDVSRQINRPLEPIRLLAQVRWSGVDIEYIKSKMIGNESLKNDPACFEFLSKVITYRLSGIQFQGLRTRHRPSTGLQTCAVIFGIGDLDDIFDTRTRDSWRVGLHSEKRVAAAGCPAEMGSDVVACSNENSAYVSGIGFSNKETWRWDSTGGWTRCGDMVQGRTQHSATFVTNKSMYALGGFTYGDHRKTLASVEQFNTILNLWTTVGQLTQSVKKSGCVAYKMSVFLLGGCCNEQSSGYSVDCVQEYNTSTQQCTMLKQ